MKTPQSLHPDIPTYAELQERIKELEHDLSEQKAINGIDIKKLKSLGWIVNVCELCGFNMSAAPKP